MSKCNLADMTLLRCYSFWLVRPGRMCIKKIRYRYLQDFKPILFCSLAKICNFHSSLPRSIDVLYCAFCILSFSEFFAQKHEHITITGNVTCYAIHWPGLAMTRRFSPSLPFSTLFSENVSRFIQFENQC